MRTVIPLAMHVPENLWHAVKALATHEGDPTPVILRALEEYVTASHKRSGRQQPGKYQQLVKAASTPVADLHLSARLAPALRMHHIRYELVQQSPTDLFRCRRVVRSVIGTSH